MRKAHTLIPVACFLGFLVSCGGYRSHLRKSGIPNNTDLQCQARCHEASKQAVRKMYEMGLIAITHVKSHEVVEFNKCIYEESCSDKPMHPLNKALQQKPKR